MAFGTRQEVEYSVSEAATTFFTRITIHRLCDDSMIVFRRANFFYKCNNEFEHYVQNSFPGILRCIDSFFVHCSVVSVLASYRQMDPPEYVLSFMRKLTHME